MRAQCLTLALAAILSLFGGGVVHGQDAPAPARVEPEWRLGALTLGGDAIVATAYVWRGFVIHDGGCVQPDIWAKVGPFTVTSWLNVRGTAGPRMHVNEHDLIVDYSRSVGAVTLSAGWTNYAFIEDGGSSDEFYVAARWERWLNPGVQVYKDVGQGSGTYVMVSGEREWDIPETRMSATVQAGLGYNHRLYVDTSGFSDLTAGLRLAIPVPSARLSLAPSINYSRSLQRHVLPSKLYGMLTIEFK